jgi:hypothetical protein
MEEHMGHLRLALQCVKEGLKLRLKKCFFALQETKYISYTDCGGKLSVLTKKVEAVKEWSVPKSLRHTVRLAVL